MTVRLKPGLALLLPSANVVRVLRRDGSDVLCEYTDQSRLRGEVTFNSAWLARHGLTVALDTPVLGGGRGKR